MTHERPFSLERKAWDSEFFGREIYELSIADDAVAASIGDAFAALDADGVWGTECHLRAGGFEAAPRLEEIGFRLVDSRMVFITRMTVEDIPNVQVPEGDLRLVETKDLPMVEELTNRYLVDNPLFKSRFKDRRLFSREESIRYYSAWNELAFRECPDLFAVWEVGGQVVAYFNYLRKGSHEEAPLFKGVLTAVAPEHRSHGVQNIMQAFLFRKFGVPEWVLDNTTQVTNLPVIRNHMRAGKRFQESVLIFYRINAGIGSRWMDEAGC